MQEVKSKRKEDFNTEKNVRGKEDIREERNTKEIEQRRENIDNRSVAGDAVWSRTSETGVTRKAWKVPVTSTTRTGDVSISKNMQAHNALLICSGKEDNKSRKAKSESNMIQTRREKKTSKNEKKAESRTLIQRIKAMKALKIEAVRSENEDNKNNVDKKVWNAILCGLRKKTNNLKLLLNKLWHVISIVKQTLKYF